MNSVTHRQHAFQRVEKAGRNEGTMADREVHVYQAKLAEQAERYDGKGYICYMTYIGCEEAVFSLLGSLLCRDGTGDEACGYAQHGTDSGGAKPAFSWVQECDLFQACSVAQCL